MSKKLKNDLDKMLDEISRPAFDDLMKSFRSLERAPLPGHAQTLHVDFLHREFMNKTEAKLLQMLRDFNYTKEQAALLLIDEREIYRRVAKTYLDEFINE